ncbi:hypothetical protein EC991_006292 [Linnemannia zychae]|nr:hypothetical protein EC991_006292 [Linnemannia zychae]
MDDLLGLSWDQKGPRQGANGAGMASGKVRPMPPPPTSKPAHLQMGLSKAGLVPTPASSNPPPVYRNNANNNGVISPSPAAAQKKNADDVFGSLIPAFGQNTASNVTKSLNSMSLDERRRHDQQQQSRSWGSLSSSPTPTTPASPFSSSTLNLSTSSFSQPSRSTASPAVNILTPAPRGYDPGNLAGLQRPIAASSPQPIPAFASPTPKLPLPFSSQQQQQPFNLSRNQSPAGGYLASPGALGRSLSPAMTPLQPERSNNSSPSTMAPTSITSLRDPFDSLLGDQVSRSSPALKNQSLNSIRNNTPPIGQQPVTKSADPWDLDFLASASTTKSAQALVSNNDVFDLGSFESAPPQKPTRQRDSVDALNSFIGKQPSPAGSPSQRTSPSSREPAVKPPQSTTTSKPTSREDADIAQIVNMGFSAERARLALAMTENGRDIEAAIEYLVQNDEAEDQLPSRGRNQSTRERGHEERRAYRDNSDPALEDRRRRNQGRGHAQQQQEPSRAQQLQQHKDKFVGTASVFGMSVLSKANELYKQGRDKVQAVVEDMTAEEPKSTSARRHQWIEDEFKPSRSQYKDSDSEEDEVYRGRREQQRQQEQRQQQQHQQQRPQASRPRQEKEAFEDTYVSSSRRGGASASRNQQPLFSMDDSPSKQKSTPTFSSGSKPSTASNPSRAARAPSPLPPKPARPPRTLVQASSQQLAESNHYKEKGNEVFKLGQFGQAAELYARAGQSLPANHILLIVTQNNHAAALLKIGEYRDTVSVCDKTILQVQGPDGQGVHDVLPESASVNLKDQMGKALMRRATAYENLEKYKEARDDWAKLKELDPGHRNAAEGQRRCEKAIAMVNGGGADGFAQPTARKPTVSASAARQGSMSTSSPMQDMFASQQRTNNDAKVKAELERSEGVSKLRQSAAQQEKEEDEKLRLTDQVEMKMTMWKAGKEDNIRALISSLGSVLWEGVGWKPVGLHELVTPSQVKIKYMRAIGKMHPDKLSASTTIEQRMMANTIFSTLNSAWDAFKVQNNM